MHQAGRRPAMRERPELGGEVKPSVTLGADGELWSAFDEERRRHAIRSGEAGPDRHRPRLAAGTSGDYPDAQRWVQSWAWARAARCSVARPRRGQGLSWSRT
jgi:hypothetical protein